MHLSRVSQALPEGFHSSSGFSVSQFLLFLHVVPDRLDEDQIRSLCGVQNLTALLQLMANINVWKCKRIFPTDTLQQKREITDFKPFLAAENTSVLII